MQEDIKKKEEIKKKEKLEKKKESNEKIISCTFKKPKTPPLSELPKPVFKNYLQKNKELAKTPYSIPIKDSFCKTPPSPVEIDESEKEKHEEERPIPTERKSLSYQSDLPSVPKMTESNVIKG